MLVWMNRCFERELLEAQLLQACATPYTHRHQPHVCLNLVLRRLCEAEDRALAQALHQRYAHQPRCRQYALLARAVVRELVEEAELEPPLLARISRHLANCRRRQQRRAAISG